MSSRFRHAFTCCLATVAVSAAAGASSCRSIPEGPQVVAAEGSNILMQVRSTEGEPIPLARVTVDDQVFTADAAGFIQLDSLPVGRFNARIDADGFASAAVVTTLAHEASPFAGVQLFSHDFQDSFDVGTEATIEGDGIRLVVPANALVDHNGEPATGMVDVAAVFVDPAEPGALDQLPSHLKATSNGGQGVMLRSFMMAEVTFSQDGVPMQVAPGELVRLELEFPPAVAGSVDVGDQIPSWSLDLDTGSWVEGSMGTVELNDAGDKVWVVYVSHFSWINCDLPITQANLRCFSVSVEDISGTLIPDLKITVTDELPGSFKDGGTTYTVPDNQGGNCVVAEMGTSEPTINIGEAGNLLASSNILSLLEATEGVSATLGGQSGVCYTDGVEAADNDDDQMPPELNVMCTPLTLTLDSAFKATCTPGEVTHCDYPAAHAAQLDTGICTANKQYCINGGLTLTECTGEVLPQDREDCLTLADDNCSGANDDYDAADTSCSCNEGSIQCYTGPTATQGVGACSEGARSCEFVANRWVYGPCEDVGLPTTEDCVTTNIASADDDENCDGEPACTGRTRSTQDSTGVVLLDAVSDSQGNIYALGYIDRGAVFTFSDSDTSDPLPPHSEKSAFLVKFDANDAADFDAVPRVEWATVYADTSALPKPTSGAALSIYEDAAGVSAIYIVGTFQGRISGPSGTLTNQAGLDDIFVARLNSAGQVEWMNGYGGDSTVAPAPADIAVSDDGSTVYLTGYAYGRFADWTSGADGDIDEDPMDADAFLVSLDALDGSQNWANTYGSIDNDTAVGLAIGGSGDLYIAGVQQGSFDAGSGQALSDVGKNPYLARFDASGTAQWVESIATNGGDVRGLAIGDDDTLFATGTVVRSLGNASNNNIYVTAYGNDGTQGWFEDLNESDDIVSPGVERSEAIALDALGNLVIAATVYSDASNQSSFEGEPLMPVPTTSTSHVAVAKITPGGALVWATHPKVDGQPGLDGTVRAVAVSPHYGDIYVAGTSLFAELAP